MWFNHSKVDPDLWMRQADDNSCYEYISVYIDGLAISVKDPKEITDDVQSKHHFKLKGTGPLAHHLGCNYTRDPDSTLMADATKYDEKILEAYECTFSSKPKKGRPLLEVADHPEADTSELCNDEKIRQYQTLTAQLMWDVALGRLDIAASVMTTSRFRQAPRIAPQMSPNDFLMLGQPSPWCNQVQDP